MAKVESTVKRVMARDEFPYEWDVIENEWITMSDGCRLSARVWHPKTDKPVPTIFETQPYRKRDGMRGRDEVYVSLAIIYWIITIIVEQGIKLIEKKIRIPENAPAIQTDEGALNQ